MEILLHTFDRPNKVGGYLPGDVIQVKPDEFDWRNAASMFRVIRLPDGTFTARQWRDLEESQWQILPVDLVNEMRDTVRLRHRRYHFDLSKLSVDRRRAFAEADKDVWTDFDAGDVIDKEDANPKFTQPEKDRSPSIPAEKRVKPIG